MASTLTAGNATNGLTVSSDNTGILELKTGTGAGTTAITISSSQVVTGSAGNLMLQSGIAVTASGTSVNFTGIPSWVKRITVMFNGVSTSGTSQVILQLGDAGGFEISGYLGTAALITGAGNTVTNFNSGALIDRADTATVVRHGAIRVNLLNASSFLWAFEGCIGRSDNNICSVMAGTKSLSDTLTQVRVTTVNGTDTFDAGTINILWE